MVSLAMALVAVVLVVLEVMLQPQTWLPLVALAHPHP